MVTVKFTKEVTDSDMDMCAIVFFLFLSSLLPFALLTLIIFLFEGMVQKGRFQALQYVTEQH